MKALLTLCILSCLAMTGVPAVHAASQPELELKVLPLDCMFDIVDDGSNQIVYLTPEPCGIASPRPTTIQGIGNPTSATIRPAGSSAIAQPEAGEAEALTASLSSSGFIKVMRDFIPLLVGLAVGLLAAFVTKFILFSFGWSFGSGMGLLARFIRSRWQ